MNYYPVGYHAMGEQLQLKALPHYRESYIARQGRGKTVIDNNHEVHIYPKSYGVHHEDDWLAHLEFALKYDGINLEIIGALFENVEKTKIVEHIKKQPTGIYSRKIWYLYEFLMKEQLDLEDCKKIKYVDLLDPNLYFTSQPIKSSRHAVYDNLLGNSRFCPIVRRTEALERYIKLHLDDKANALLEKYDPHLIVRACNYLYTKETMSSYQIEKEEPDKNRITRFVDMLKQATTMDSLSKEKLIELKNIIVDPRFRSIDYRYNQNYVGENISLYFQKIHYISPRPEDVPDLMQGLLDSLDRMVFAGVHPVIIAAAVSFGFVFIHPFEDGNGRIHRFLIHYILSKNKFTPHGMVFPVSSIMLKNMGDYDGVLESFSKPLLSILSDYHLSDDGIMTVKQESKLFYQYIDFTVMVEYLFSCINEAIHNHIEQEIQFLINYDIVKHAIQEIVDMPDHQIDLFIKCILQNGGKLSARKRNSFFPLLTEDEIKNISEIIRNKMMPDHAS